MKSINSRLNSFLITGVILSSLLMATIFGIIIYRKSLTDLRENSASTVRLAAISLSGPLWDLDESNVRKIADSLLADPYMQGIHVGDGFRTVLELTENNDIDFSKEETDAYIIAKEDVFYDGKPVGLVKLAISKESAQTQINQLFQVLSVHSVGLCLMIGLIIYLVGKNVIKRPIKALRDAAEKIASGDLDYPISIARDDELGRLTGDVGRMRDAIKEKMAIIHSYTSELESKVSERTKELREKEHELSRAYSDLKKSDEAKTRFFQNVSHEIRTPLTLILNPLARELGKDAQNESLSTCYKNAKRLLRLVNQLLDFQKIEQGKYDIKLSTMDLKAFLRSGVPYFEEECQIKGVALEVDIDGNQDYFVSAQADALEKILFNFMSNALKYGSSGGRIVIGLSTSASGMAALWVKDFGPGIAQAEQAKLFQVFSQLSTNQSEQEGSGLGLALVKELAEKLNGQVLLESEEGQGARFICELPKVAPALETLVEPVNFKNRSWYFDSNQEIYKDAGQKPANREKPLILVAEDNPELLKILVDLLRKNNYDVVPAQNGKEAYDKALELLPDVILTDWMMPLLSGPDMITQLKNEPLTTAIPTILLTAKASEASRRLGRSVGASVYLEKPFEDQELLTSVKNLVAIRSESIKARNLTTHLSENVLKRYLPPELVNRILSGEYNLDETVKVEVITVIFADLVGFTTRTEELGPRGMSQVLNAFLEKMIDVIFAAGGTVDKFIGDGIMVLFGAPLALPPEKQIHQAVDCAKKMQAGLRELNKTWLSKFNIDFKMRIGIHHGAAIVGNFGSKKRSDFTAIGSTVNLAARVESAAKPNEILVTSVVRDFLPEDGWKMSGRYQLKGFASDVTLYRIVTENDEAEARGAA